MKRKMARDDSDDGVDVDRRIVFADIRRLFRSNGELLPESQWPPEVAEAVESVQRWAGGFQITLKPKGPALGRLLDRLRDGA